MTHPAPDANGGKRWSPRKAPYYRFLLYFGASLALMLFQVGTPDQRQRWIFSVFPICFAVVCVLHALHPKGLFLFEARSGEKWIPRWIAGPILLSLAGWLFYSWIPVILGYGEFPTK